MTVLKNPNRFVTGLYDLSEVKSVNRKNGSFSFDAVPVSKPQEEILEVVKDSPTVKQTIFPKDEMSHE